MYTAQTKLSDRAASPYIQPEISNACSARPAIESTEVRVLPFACCGRCRRGTTQDGAQWPRSVPFCACARVRKDKRGARTKDKQATRREKGPGCRL